MASNKRSLVSCTDDQSLLTNVRGVQEDSDRKDNDRSDTDD
jgi:hypothetical protein